MIKVEQATQAYEKQTIFSDVNFSIEKGERVAIVGRNGAGKSTLLYALLGFSELKKGTITYDGKPVTVNKKGYNGNLSFLPEKFQLYLQLSVLENVQYFANMLHLKKEETERVLRLTNMWEAKEKQITELSKGMLQRVGLSIVLLGDPATIVLDEPTSGLDPFGRTDFINIMKKVGTDEKTILFTTHNMNEVKELATHVLYVHDQQIEKLHAETFLDTFEGSIL